MSIELKEWPRVNVPAEEPLSCMRWTFKDVKIIFADSVIDCKFHVLFDNFRPHVAIKLRATEEELLPTNLINLAISSPPRLQHDNNAELQGHVGSDGVATALITQDVVGEVKLWQIPVNGQSETIQSTFSPQLTEVILEMKASAKYPVLFLWEIRCVAALTVISDQHVKLPAPATSFLEFASGAPTLRLLFSRAADMSRYLERMSGVLTDRSPVLKRFTNTNGRFDTKRFDPSPIPQSEIGYRKCEVFISSLEYVSAMYAGATIEHEHEIQKEKAYEAGEKVLILVDDAKIRRAPLPKFTGLITAPTKDQCRLKAGTTIEIDFRNPQVKREQYTSWRATVTEQTNVKKRGFVGVLVEKFVEGTPRDADEDFDESDKGSDTPSDDSTTHAEKGLKVIRARTMADGRAQYLVRKSEEEEMENIVKVKLENKYSAYFAVKNAYQFLGSSDGSQTAATFRSRILKVLQGRDCAKLDCQDLYRHVQKKGEKDIAEVMATLNSSQQLAVKSSRRSKGGLLIVQGPPGTGKTFVLQQMIAPFLVNPKSLPVLVAAPTNPGADDMAQHIHSCLQNLRRTHAHAKQRYILRLHSPDTEREICLTQYSRSTLSGFSQGPSSSASKVLSGQPKATTASNFHGVSDPRVQNTTFSVGYMILLVSGVIAGTEFEHPDPYQYEAFRALYDGLKDGKKSKMSPGDMSKWEKGYERLFKQVVEGASAIISTTHGVTAGSVLTHVKGKVAAIFLEENAFEREDQLAPIFATEFTLDPFIVVIGDPEQLSPFIQSAQDQSRRDSEMVNAFAEQLETSFMTRQIALGKEYIMLTEQYRSVADIVELPNVLTYRGLLTSAPGTLLENRPLAMKFREFAETKTGQPCNRMLVNVPASLTNRTETNDQRSKGNHYIVCVVGQILEELAAKFRFDKGSADYRLTIAVLTPYGHQRSLYTQMKRTLSERGHPLVQTIAVDNFHTADRFTVGTVDSNQGRQFNFVIIDLPVNTHLGFLSDEKRLNVAITRARDGLIIVCDQKAVNDAIRRAGSKASYLSKLLGMFKEKTWNRAKSDEYPRTTFYTPPAREGREEDYD